MVKLEGDDVSFPVMGKDLTHRLQHVRTVTWAIVFHSPYHSLSLSRLHCFVKLRAFQWQESNFFFFEKQSWSDKDAKTFLELAVFPSGRPAHSSLLFSIFKHPLFTPKSFTLAWENGVKCVFTSSPAVNCDVVFKEKSRKTCTQFTVSLLLYIIYYISWLHSFTLLCRVSPIATAYHQFSSLFDSKMFYEVQKCSFFQGLLTLQQMAVWIPLSAQASLLRNCCFCMFMVIQTTPSLRIK